MYISVCGVRDFKCNLKPLCKKDTPLAPHHIFLATHKYARDNKSNKCLPQFYFEFILFLFNI